MNPRFNGKTILITGGNSGIGFTTAQRIVSEGGRVIITGRDAHTLEQAQKELGAMAEAIQSDAGNLSSIDSLFVHIKEKYGQIDGVFANAGIAKFKPVLEVTEADFDQLFDINVKGVFFTLQKAVPLLKPGGSVVLNASVAASNGGALTSVYGATKAAVRSMARTFSAAFVSNGLRFNAVSPGPIETPIWQRASGIPKEALEPTVEAIKEGNPMKRYGKPEEVAATVAFLLSDESTYTMGAEIFVDGGVNQL